MSLASIEAEARQNTVSSLLQSGLYGPLQSVLPQTVELCQCHVCLHSRWMGEITACSHKPQYWVPIVLHVPGSLCGLCVLISFSQFIAWGQTLTTFFFLVWFKDSDNNQKVSKRSRPSKSFPQWYLDMFGLFSLSFSHVYTWNFSACYLYVLLQHMGGSR